MKETAKKKLPRDGRELKRRQLAEVLADHLLAEGLAEASLRPLAAAAGTSDRMLLYYFDNKDELLAVVLGLAAERLARLLEKELSKPRKYEKLLPAVCELVSSPDLRPYMQLWLEAAARASREEEPYRQITGAIFDGFLDWVGARLEVERESDRAGQAALLLATVEGIEVLNAIGREQAVALALEGLRRQRPGAAKYRGKAHLGQA